MFTFCPVCASKNIIFANGKVFRCPDCGFVYYHNTAAATGCIISVPENAGNNNATGNTTIGGTAIDGTPTGSTPTTERIMFLVRGKEPAKGKLDLPGGFVDPGEGALEGLYRELQEEIGWSPPVPHGASLTKVFTLFASFPNVYPYKNISYNTCDMYFYLRAPGLSEQDLHLEHSEISAVRFLNPQEINYDEIAFDSTRRAVRTYLSGRYYMERTPAGNA